VLARANKPENKRLGGEFRSFELFLSVKRIAAELQSVPIRGGIFVELTVRPHGVSANKDSRLRGIRSNLKQMIPS